MTGLARGIWVRLTSAVTLAAFMGASLPALAQGVGASEQLYREGGELMKAGKVHEACGKFAASYRADNTAVGSLLATAACHEKEGKTAAAWGEYSAVAVIARRDGQTDREQYAVDHAKAIESKLHHVIIAPSFDVTTPPDGFAVQLDGAPFDAGALNSQIPIDSGVHTLTVSATGKTSWTTKFTTAADTKTDTIAVPALVDAPKTQAQTIVIQDNTTTHLNKTKLAFGIIFGVVGVGGVGAAIGLGLHASSLNQASITASNEATASSNGSATNPADNCPGASATNTVTCVNSTNHTNYAKQNHDAASTSQTIAIAAGIVGGLSLVAGVFFLVTSPETKNSSPPPDVDKPATAFSQVRVLPILGPQMNGLGLSGSF